VKLDSVSHSILRAIATTSCTAAVVMRAIRADGHDIPHSEVLRVLHRLSAQMLATSDEQHQWSASAYGMAVSAGIGPANVPIIVTTSAPTAHEVLAQQTPTRPRSSLGNGDLRPPVMRPGADVALRLPSVINGVRRWPDGRRESA
jgi:hypothetical protein